MIRIDLSKDHGKNHSPAESYLIGKMLENAYRAGYEAGMRSTRGEPWGWDLETACCKLGSTITKMKQGLQKKD